MDGLCPVALGNVAALLQPLPVRVTPPDHSEDKGSKEQEEGDTFLLLSVESDPYTPGNAYLRSTIFLLATLTPATNR